MFLVLPFFSGTETTNFKEDFNQYTTFTEARTNKTIADNLLGIGNLNLEYTPNSKEKMVRKNAGKKN